MRLSHLCMALAMVALSGGAALADDMAATPTPNAMHSSMKSRHMKSNSMKSGHMKSNSMKSNQMKSNSMKSEHMMASPKPTATP